VFCIFLGRPLFLGSGSSVAGGAVNPWSELLVDLKISMMDIARL
jgi:hypothetical protein